jgi:anion-transporting  ArsA/GET3 family ATPase
MAMEKLGQLRARDVWDLIIVDTPPSRSRWTSSTHRPGSAGSSTAGCCECCSRRPAPAAAACSTWCRRRSAWSAGPVTKVLGTQLLADLSGFVAALDSMFGGFRARAEQTYRVLQDRETAFLLVAAPEPDAIREAAYFAERLAVDDMPLAGSCSTG